MKSMNENIAAMLAKLNYKNVNTNNQEEKLTDPSSKISTYEDHRYKFIIKKMLQPLTLQVNNEKDDKITELSSKLSTY